MNWEKEQKEHRSRVKEADRVGSRTALRGLRGAERASGEREGRACEEALRGTRSPAYAPEAAMPRDAAHMPGSLRARGLVPGAGNRRRPWVRGRRGRQLRAAAAAALALPPVGQGRLAARACPQCPPRLRLPGLAGGTCTGGRWGGEVRTPVPAAGQPPARPPLPSSFRVVRRLALHATCAPLRVKPAGSYCYQRTARGGRGVEREGRKVELSAPAQ